MMDELVHCHRRYGDMMDELVHCHRRYGEAKVYLHVIKLLSVATVHKQYSADIGDDCVVDEPAW
jgi:hypothetical protein